MLIEEPYVNIRSSSDNNGAEVSFNIDCENDGIIDQYNIQVSSCFYPDYQYRLSKTIRIQHSLDNNEGFPSLFFNVFQNNPLVSIDQWGTGKWYTMKDLFRFSDRVSVNSDVPNTSELFTMQNMFTNAENIEIDLSQWNTSSVTNMSGTFAVTNMMADVSNWDTSNVQDMSSLFNLADYVFPGIANWDISSVTNMDNIFRNAPLSNELYDQILINFGSQIVNSNLTLDVGDTQYCSQEALAAKNHLINTYKWNIIDGGDCDFIYANGFE